jgi:hypothetical protein
VVTPASSESTLVSNFILLTSDTSPLPGSGVATCP